MNSDDNCVRGAFGVHYRQSGKARAGRIDQALAPTIDFTQETSDEKVSISIAYSDTRFAALPFLPDLSNLAPVNVDYYVTDPSG